MWPPRHINAPLGRPWHVGIVPHCLWRLGCTPFVLYIDRKGPLFSTQKNTHKIPEKYRKILLICLFSFFPLSLSLVWFPSLELAHEDWRHGTLERFLHHTHAVVLLDSRSGSVFFRCSAGSESGGRRTHRMCASTTRCCTCGTRHRWSFYTAMRSSWAYVFTDNVPTGT